ncbi:MAG: CHAT domain-containing tetratricopeptide repeat protein [Sedimenticola sp.]
MIGQGSYGEAESLLLRSLEIREQRLGERHPKVGMALVRLAQSRMGLGEHTKAEADLKRAVEILEPLNKKRLLATALEKLGKLYKARWRHAEAETLLRRSLSIRKAIFGPLDHRTLQVLGHLSDIYRTHARFAEAEALFQEALQHAGNLQGNQQRGAFILHSNLAKIHHGLRHFRPAEKHYREALLVAELLFGAEHYKTGEVLNALGKMYFQQGRYSDAEELLKRALFIRKKRFGEKHRFVAQSLSNLGNLYRKLEQYEEALPLLQQALELWLESIGVAHPKSVGSLVHLANYYRNLGDLERAETLYRKGLASAELIYPADHPTVARIRSEFATVRRRQGHADESVSLLKQVIPVQQKELGDNHPRVAESMSRLAKAYDRLGKRDKALSLARKATDIYRQRFLEESGGAVNGALFEQRSVRDIFTHHVRILDRLESIPLKDRVDEAFRVAQLARSAGTGRAVARMASRFGTADDELGRQIRSRQDAVDRWQVIDLMLLEASTLAPEERIPEREKELRTELAAIAGKIEELDLLLAEQFPEYGELTNPQPLSIQQVQLLLAHDEAMVGYLLDKKESYLWVIRHNAANMYRLSLGREEIVGKVQHLRRHLDPRSIELIEDIPPYPVDDAFELYRSILQDSENELEGVSHLMLVNDGPLQGLPFAVLVTEPPGGDIRQFADYNRISWLAKRHALTVLPSVGSLRALRRFAKGSVAAKPFGGFGDPQLQDDSSGYRGLEGLRLVGEDGGVDVELLRLLPSLPDTADELRAMAVLMEADEKDLFLRKQANESRVKSMALDNYRVIAFATHGALSGEIEGLDEPALVLTPPARGSERDDGLLTSSEIARLKLNADWILLSACNTAASDGTPGGEGLSGLAKAFFYAGSRALLVSHWAVSSSATVELTTGMFRYLSEHPGISRSEGLRRSMLNILERPEQPYFSHPMFWAPFVVVGEGGT